MKKTVVKFGGTSLADAAQIKKAADIIHGDPARCLVVASAPGKRNDADIKITDLLYKCHELSESEQNFEPVLKKIEQRFTEIRDALSVEFDIKAEIAVLRNALLSFTTREYMASRGEYLNSKLIAAYLGFPFIDPKDCVFFDENGVLLAEKTKKGLKAALSGKESAVVAGFYGSYPDGNICTFSRGGSDVTGGLLAEAAEADLYENWTDVSGLLAADPRIVDNPRVVSFISYRELRILSYMGASVLHTDAVLPASRAGIPINIRNTNRPQDPGTMIVPVLPEDRDRERITGVAGRQGLAVIQIEKSMTSDGAGFTALILDIFKRERVPFEQCLTGIDTVSLVIRSDFLAQKKEQILKDIQEDLQPDRLNLIDDLSMITVVGEGNKDVHSSTVRILKAVAAAGVQISTINQGAGNLNLIIGVPNEDYRRTIMAIYHEIA